MKKLRAYADKALAKNTGNNSFHSSDLFTDGTNKYENLNNIINNEIEINGGEIVAISPQEDGNKMDLSNNNEKNQNNEADIPSDWAELSPLLTDRDLLTIVNISNLRLEFAKLTIIDERTNLALSQRKEKKISDYHTLVSMYDQEINSIKGEKKNKTLTRVFFDLENDEDSDNPEIPLYTKVDPLKITSGVSFEYFERYKKSEGKNPMTVHMDKWHPIYAADGLKLVYDYNKFLNHSENENYKSQMRGSLLQLLNVAYEEDLDKVVNRLSAIVASYPYVNPESNSENGANDSNSADSCLVILRGMDLLERSIIFEADFSKEKPDLINGKLVDHASGKGIYMPEAIEKEIIGNLSKILNEDKVSNMINLPTRKTIIDYLQEIENSAKKTEMKGILLTILFGGIAGYKIAGDHIKTVGDLNRSIKDANKNIDKLKKSKEDMARELEKEIPIDSARTTAKQRSMDKKLGKSYIKIGEEVVKGKAGLKNFFEQVAENIDDLEKLEKLANTKAKKKALEAIRKAYATTIYDKAVLVNANPAMNRMNFAKAEEALAQAKAASIERFKTIYEKNGIIDGIKGDVVPKIVGNLPGLLEKLPAITVEESKKVEKVINENYESLDRKGKLAALYYKCNYFKDISNEILTSTLQHVEKIIESMEKSLINNLSGGFDEETKGILEEYKKQLHNIKYNDDVYSSIAEYPLDYFDFRVSVFANKDIETLVLCFNGKSRHSTMTQDLKEGKYKNLFLLFEIVRNYLIEYLKIECPEIKNYKLHVTGNGIGADLADMYYLATNTPTTIFRTTAPGIDNTFRFFNSSTIAALFNMQYQTGSDIRKNSVNSFFAMAFSETFYGGIGHVLGAVVRTFLISKAAIVINAALVTKLGFSIIYGGLVTPAMIVLTIYLAKAIEIYSNNKYFDYFYVELCRLGFIECLHCGRDNNKSIEKCIYLKTENKEKAPSLRKAAIIKKLLGDYVTIKDGGKYKNGVKVTGETYLKVLTEYFYYSKNLLLLTRIFDNPNKKNHFYSEGVVKGDKILTITKEDENDILTVFFEDLKKIGEYEPELYHKVSDFFKGKFFTYASCVLIKDTYLKLEVVNGIGKLVKKCYYKCLIDASFIESNVDSGLPSGEIITVDNKEYDDTTLGSTASIFLQMINFIISVQETQRKLESKIIKKTFYKVYAFGIPDYKKKDCTVKEFTPIVYAKNKLLSASEIKNLGKYLLVEEFVATDAVFIHRDKLDIWNEEHNSHIIERFQYPTAIDFPFFPFINDQGMIADLNLFCYCNIPDEQHQANEEAENSGSSSETTQTNTESRTDSDTKSASTTDSNDIPENRESNSTTGSSDLSKSEDLKVESINGKTYGYYHSNGKFPLDKESFEIGKAHGSLINNVGIEKADSLFGYNYFTNKTSEISFYLGQEMVTEGLVKEEPISNALITKINKFVGRNLSKDFEGLNAKLNNKDTSTYEVVEILIATTKVPKSLENTSLAQNSSTSSEDQVIN